LNSPGSPLAVRMEDTTAAGKRSAPTSVLKTAKKINAKQLDLQFGELEAGGLEQKDGRRIVKKLQIVEPEEDHSIVSTKANPHVFNPFLESLSESSRAEARSPYLKMFGEDKGDQNAFHDDLQVIIVMAARWIYNEATLSQAKLKLVKESSHEGLRLHLVQWTNINRILFSEDEETIQVLSQEEKTQFKMISTRLSHTKPNAIADQRVTNSKVGATHATRAWRGAVNILGSAYNLNMGSHGPTTGGSIKETPKKRATSQKIHQFFAPHETNQKTTPAVSPSPMKNDSTRRRMAVDTMKECKKSVRLMIAIKLGKDEVKTPNDLAFEHIKAMLIHYQKNDQSTCIVPWKVADLATHSAITSPKDIPNKMSEFKKIYAEGICPKSNSTCWFKMRLGCSEEPIHFTSTNGSDTQDYFTDSSDLAYMCTVQDSDDTVDLCDFIYSGPFSNPNDFEVTLREALKKPNVRQYKFGCRIKKSKELQEPKVVKDWLFKPNMMIHLEVDRSQAKALKQELYRLFNKVEENKVRPGGYNFRVLPDKSQMRSGTRGARDRINMLHKHQANVMSLVVLKSYDIKDIDDSQVCNKESYTLRELLLNITFPLVPKKKRNAPKLFFTVDYAASGQDKDRGAVYFTAYHDRKELAAKVVDILPAYIEHYHGRDLAKKWCHPASMGIIQDITFLVDEDGNDTGEWTTMEDEMGQDILDEDMGIRLDLGNLALLEIGEGRVLHNADDASANSFRSALGAEHMGKGNQTDSEILGASLATGASNALSGEETV
jgi:hypothetical protein